MASHSSNSLRNPSAIANPCPTRQIIRLRPDSPAKPS